MAIDIPCHTIYIYRDYNTNTGNTVLKIIIEMISGSLYKNKQPLEFWEMYIHETAYFCRKSSNKQHDFSQG